MSPLLVVSVACAAFCIWLAVRIVNRKERWAKWKRAWLPLVLLAYVLSSGPMHAVAFRHDTVIGIDPDGSSVFADRGGGKSFRKVYAPIVWASEQSWGRPVKQYWRFFPIQEQRE